MEKLINVFDVELTGDSAKDTVRKIAMSLEEERIFTVDIVTLEMLLNEKDNEVWKKQMQAMDLLFPGDKEILQAAENVNKTLTKETDKKDFAKLLLRYLQKNKKTIFLLSEKEEELSVFQTLIVKNFQNIRIVGKAVLEEESIERDSVINDINSLEPDCILSVLSSPWQEKFIAENKALLNTRAWIGLGVQAVQKKPKRKTAGKIKTFILKKVFHYQLEKQSEE